MAYILYLDTCLPDYFQGFGGHVYAVPLDSGDTYKTVLNTLLTQVKHEEVYRHDGEEVTETDYEELENSVFNTFLPENMGDIFCTSLEKDDEENQVYAYFGAMFDD